MTVKVAAAQYPILKPRDWAEWEAHMATWIAEAADAGAQLLVFPEYGSMALVGLLEDHWHSDLQGQIQEMGRLLPHFLSFLVKIAQEKAITIVAPSFPVLTEGGFVNRTFVVGRQGLGGYQDKLFMTRFEREEWGITAPMTPEYVVFKADWGTFGIQTCYDIEFPLGSHHLAAAGALLIVAPSCTETLRGATRVHIGARARALEQQCYTLVAQTVGEALWSPAVDLNYGFAAAYSTPDRGLPEEGIIAQKAPQEIGWLVVDLDFQDLITVRQQGQVFNYKDSQRQAFYFEDKTVPVKIITL